MLEVVRPQQSKDHRQKCQSIVPQAFSLRLCRLESLHYNEKTLTPALSRRYRERE
jgi:hypothetical protein